MADPKKKKQGEVDVLERPRTKRPQRWKVLLYNDDYTTMEFVVAVLGTVFHLSPSEATRVMLKVHTEGRGVAGIYTHDVAESKVLAVPVFGRISRAISKPFGLGVGLV